MKDDKVLNCRLLRAAGVLLKSQNDTLGKTSSRYIKVVQSFTFAAFFISYFLCQTERFTEKRDENVVRQGSRDKLLGSNGPFICHLRSIRASVLFT